MSKITGKDLKNLGFKKEVEKPTLDPEDNGYHYYTYEINKHCLLLSSSSDEKDVDGGYYVEFYEIEKIRFTKLEDLKKLIKLLKKAAI
jgi:hypothetical protein